MKKRPGMAHFLKKGKKIFQTEAGNGPSKKNACAFKGKHGSGQRSERQVFYQWYRIDIEAMPPKIRSTLWNTSWQQCDQMARLFFQFLAIYNNESLHSKEMFSKLGLQFCQILNKSSKDSQRVLKFCQSAEISPNLVTLDWGSSILMSSALNGSAI